MFRGLNDKYLEYEQDECGFEIVRVFNKEKEHLGNLVLEQVGAHMHWCWRQSENIRMSPGCLQEVRDKQKELFKDRGKDGKK